METLLLETLLSLGAALCPLGIIVLVLWFIVSVVLPLRQKLHTLRRLHTTPCDRCCYFNPDPELHCAVHPDIVLTRFAKQCRDFDARLRPSPTILERGLERGAKL